MPKAKKLSINKSNESNESKNTTTMSEVKISLIWTAIKVVRAKCEEMLAQLSFFHFFMCSLLFFLLLL